MILFTIYDQPRDFPEQVVLRCWRVLPDSIEAAREEALFDTVAEARAWLAETEPGLICLGRAPHDDPVIVETWTLAWPRLPEIIRGMP